MYFNQSHVNDSLTLQSILQDMHSSEGTKVETSDEALRLSTSSSIMSELELESIGNDQDDPPIEKILPQPVMSINLEPVNLIERLFTSNLMNNFEGSSDHEIFAHMVAKAGSSIRDTGYSSQVTRDQSLAYQVR